MICHVLHQIHHVIKYHLGEFMSPNIASYNEILKKYPINNYFFNYYNYYDLL
jgi:hypothetical protein